MKKIIIIAVLLFGLQNHAQKIFKIHNWSSYTVTVDDLHTKPASGSYPIFATKPYTAGSPQPLTIAPGNTYTLSKTHTTRFPFESTSGSSPTITNWEKCTSASGTSCTVITSATAWPLGDAQVFYFLQFKIDGETAHIDDSDLDGSDDDYSGTNWGAEYTLTATETSPGHWLKEYNVYIFDN